ncbi:F-box only protein 39-like [Patiria miniata]|uniref:F-box domain-containing protein n=1 Tax=Patiria miniata TaxID=46514 RepID=A0A914A8V2_PATMI|nr:F-box only protein 39-like [Patiria miniata]
MGEPVSGVELELAVPGTSQDHPGSFGSEAGPSTECLVSQPQEQVDWSLLPDVATTMIAAYLLPWQRGYMAMTCNNWNRAIMKSPHLWRTKDFRIHGNWRDSHHLSYVKSVGRHLKRVYCSFGFRSHRYPRRMQKLFTALLAELYRSGPVQLLDLHVTSLQFNRNFQTPECDRARKGILKSLNRFLRRQTILQTLDLSEDMLRVDEGVALLSSVSECSSASLKMLYIDETFQQGAGVNADRSFVRIMGRFTKLVEVTVNYSCLSAELLSRLAASCSSTLEVLSITTHRHDNHEHTINRDAWVDFCEASPGTRVTLSMSGIVRMAAVYRILTPGMPLVSLRTFGHNDGGFHPDRTLRHLSRHFHHSIRKIVMDVGPVYHPYARGLDCLIRNCSKLENLQIHGRISWPALRDVFDFLDEAYIKKGLRPSLTYFRVVITTIGFGQEEALVMEEFRPMFDQHNLNYELVFDPMYPLPLGPLVPVGGEEQVDDVIEVW